MSSPQAIGIWAVSACVMGAIILRPRGIPESVWAVLGAAVTAAIAWMAPVDIWNAILSGAHVYAFLIGILGLAELGRVTRVFDWAAIRLLQRANGSEPRLLGLVYLLGIVVTVLLSNDTTVVVLTPAVIAMLSRTSLPPLPYLFACAFVSNAASFVLPISNPANLVLFGRALPPLVPWVLAFGPSSVAATALTYVTLRLVYRHDLRKRFALVAGAAPASAHTALGAALLGVAALVLVLAAFAGMNVGYTALLCAALAMGMLAFRAPRASLEAIRHTNWSIVPLVAALFVIVTALDRSGVIALVRNLLQRSDAAGTAGVFATGVLISLASNVLNNLPVALAAGAALQATHVSPRLFDATLVAVDLGPNLSASGSLATLLWLTVLRRAGINVTPMQFLRIGVIVLAPALIAALLLVR